MSGLTVERPYSPEDVERLRGSVVVEHTLARRGAQRLRALLEQEEWVAALGALTGGQAVQMVKAGLKAIYLSGWQVAADANLAGQTYPDQSLYPASSAPALVKRINNALLRADQIAHAEGDDSIDWLAPIVADAEAGFGGPLNAFELMKAFIEAGAAAVHFEDQLSSEKKCGHLGGKVLVPSSQFVRTLVAARLAADVLDVPTLLVARTDALSATLLDERHRRVRPRVLHRRAHARGLLPRARRHPRRDRARARLRALRGPALVRDLDARPRGGRDLRARDPRRLPRQAARLQLLAVVQLEPPPLRAPDRELPARPRARSATASSSSRSPASTHSTRRCSSSRAATAERAMSAYVELQEREFAAEADGYTATRHQREVGVRLLRRRARGGQRRHELDARAARLDRGAAVPGSSARCLGARRGSSVPGGAGAAPGARLRPEPRLSLAVGMPNAASSDSDRSRLCCGGS